MNKPLYTPRPDSIPAKVIAFFESNPDEELTLDDIAAKFDTQRKNVHTNLALAVDAGAVKRCRDEDGEYFYVSAQSTVVAATLGTKKAAKPSTAKDGINIDQVHMGAPRTPAKGFTSLRYDLIDFDALVVEEGIPLPSKSQLPGADKWAPLFAKLTKPGQSLVIPINLRTAVGAAATKRNRAKTQGRWRVAMVSDKVARVWRME